MSSLNPKSLQDLQQVVEQIHKHSGKIPVAKKESSQLINLCNDLIKRTSDRSLILQQPNYEDIKRELALVEGKLAVWSKYNYPKSLMKRPEIELGIAACVEQLFSVIPRREGASEEVTGDATGIDHNEVRFTEPLPRPTAKRETESQPAEANGVPLVKILDGEVERLGEIAFTGGTRCEVWVGQWEKGGGKEGRGEGVGGEKVDAEKVALKAFKPLKSSERTRKRLERELPGWVELRHQNILPFYGIVTDIGSYFYLVSPWQENGNLLAYVKESTQPNKTHLLRGSAAGLSYLHSRGVVHGSVKCKNVLVSHEGEPLVCDFGIAKVVEEATENTVSKTVSSGDGVRYSAPELIEDNHSPTTTHSDTYSFAMLIIECITEEMPFSHIHRDAAVIHARIIKRQCPPRPDGQDPKNRVSDSLWDLMMHCWSVKPDQRPTMEQFHRFFLPQD